MDLLSAQRMIEAAYAAGGLAAARHLYLRLLGLYPYLAAALVGWIIGRFLDNTFNISDRILETLYPSSSLGPRPDVNLDWLPEVNNPAADQAKKCNGKSGDCTPA